MPKNLKEALEIIKNPPLLDPYTGKPLATEAYTRYKDVVREIKSSNDVKKLLMEIIRQCKAEAAPSAITSFIAGVVVGLEMEKINVVIDVGTNNGNETDSVQ